MKTKKISKLISKLSVCVLTGINCIFTNVNSVFAGDDDPWVALNNGGTTYERIQVLPALYRLCQVIGIMGCVLTSVFYVVQIIFKPSTARGVNAGKEGFKYKLIIAFFICTALTFMGIIWQFIATASGY